MKKLPNPVWLRSFDAAARHLNFTAAAQELGITQTAVSLHIRALEADLRCKLFIRNARNLTLTEMGQAYAMTLRRTLGEIASATNSLFGATGSQVLTVRAPISTAALFLVQHLPGFVAENPGISIRLVSNIWADSVESEDVDVEIRLGRGDWPGITAKQISQERLVPIVSSRLSGPFDLETLCQGPMIQILGYEDMWGRYLDVQGLTLGMTPMAYAVDTTVAALGIVAGGGGVAVVLERFAQQATADGHPVRIAGPAVPLNQAHYLLGHAGKPETATAKTLFEDWVTAVFSDDG
ncbi:LysR family transcriptional regulator [Shimia sp. SDUM112013]|uniref:LysR family transcriptional regulator n=1 Tax=Shimia sp. SDUM112013 TaxID=3136160 RepID=UPI0032ED16E7